MSTFAIGDTVRLVKTGHTGRVVTADESLLTVGVSVEVVDGRSGSEHGQHVIQVLPADLVKV